MSSPIMKYFNFDHLPAYLAQVSEPVYYLAHKLDRELPDCAEKSAGLRKLLEAKDCFVHAAISDLAESFRQAHNAADGPQVDREPSTTDVFMLHSHGDGQHSHEHGKREHTHEHGRVVFQVNGGPSDAN